MSRRVTMRLTLCTAALAALVPLAAHAQAQPAARTTPAHAATSTSMASAAVTATFQKIENDWGTAWAANDTASVARLLAPEYVGVNRDGSRSDRAAEIASTATAKATNVHIDPVTVRQYGEVAVVVGTASYTTTADGSPKDVRYRYTDVFVRRHGAWQAVSSQGTNAAP